MASNDDKVSGYRRRHALLERTLLGKRFNGFPLILATLSKVEDDEGRWMRVIERDGDTNEDAGRRKDVEEGEEEEAEEEAERRERKEGVRVRVRLGVGGAIRNYCGTIDKRRLRGRTTEDSLRPSDFPSTVASPPLFRFSLFPGSFGLPHSRHAVLSVPVSCPRNLPDSTRARATPSSSGRSTWNRRFYPTLYISVDAPSKPRWDTGKSSLSSLSSSRKINFVSAFGAYISGRTLSGGVRASSIYQRFVKPPSSTSRVSALDKNANKYGHVGVYVKSFSITRTGY
ncbi:hypothetical protein DBV15_08937 [Temnothorax longispinosus]|uniref:Uncharacterized protein n=1 Tax=Temnothorax longispinosus TaxID=300112 RepID=A0A4S2JDI7_9HYME|nr:hypothetical protein DBV15_08937 [Temnothorax longispinosus]